MNPQKLHRILALAYHHGGKIYGGFVRDFIARSFMKEVGEEPLGKRAFYYWAATKQTFEPYVHEIAPGNTHKVSITGCPKAHALIAKALPQARMVELPTETQFFFDLKSQYRFKDIDLRFPDEAARSAFIQEFRMLYSGLEPQEISAADSPYGFSVIKFAGIFPQLDLVVGADSIVNDSPVNLLTYDGAYLAVETAPGLPELSLAETLALIKGFRMPLMDAFIERVSKKDHAQVQRLWRLFGRGWDLVLSQGSISTESQFRLVFGEEMTNHLSKVTDEDRIKARLATL